MSVQVSYYCPDLFCVYIITRKGSKSKYLFVNTLCVNINNMLKGAINNNPSLKTSEKLLDFYEFEAVQQFLLRDDIQVWPIHLNISTYDLITHLKDPQGCNLLNTTNIDYFFDHPWFSILNIEK
jgi:hypothetical protein